MNYPLRILFGTSVLARGHGVSLVIRELALRLHQLMPRALIAVAAMHRDQDYTTSLVNAGIDVLPCIPELAETVVNAWRPDIFLPHTGQFFAMDPQGARLVVYEHGDPSPQLFVDDRGERERQRLSKQLEVYARADAVVAISDFQRHDLPWPQAKLIYNGCNHVPDYGPKEASQVACGDEPFFRLGVLSRLDGGEAFYKGFELLQQLAPLLRREIGGLKLEYCGKISPAQATILSAEGWQVHAGVSDHERNKWLRSCHVVLSPSLWEGFNLPLVEAQALGTMALAFDTGAHPEVTPHTCGGLAEMQGLLITLNQDRELLAQFSAEAYSFVRDRFDWDKAAVELMQLLSSLSPLRNL